MSTKKKTKEVKPVDDQIKDLFAAVCAEYQANAEGLADEHASSPDANKKTKSHIKRKVTVWLGKLDELLTKPRTLNIPMPDNATPEGPLPGEVVAEPAAGTAATAVLATVTPADQPDLRRKEPGEGPGELVVAIKSARKGVNALNVKILEVRLGRKASRTDTQDMQHGGKDIKALLVAFAYDDHLDAQAAADDIDGTGYAFVVGTSVDAVAPEKPDDQIELQVDVTSTGAALQEHVASMEAALERKAGDVVEDGAGATIYFDYPTLKEAGFAKLMIDGAIESLPFVKEVVVGDPMEGRFSEEEIERINKAPRALVRYTFPANGGTCTYCTRCVELGHKGEEPTAAPVPVPNEGEEECDYCGWSHAPGA